MANIRLLAIALMVAGATAGCDQTTVETNVQNLLDFGDPPPTEPLDIPPKAANPPQVNTEPSVNEEPTGPIACEPFTGEFRVWHCEDGWRMYP